LAAGILVHVAAMAVTATHSRHWNNGLISGILASPTAGVPAMSSIDTGPEQPGDLLLGAIRSHWVLFLVEGLLLIAFGATAIILPGIAALTVTILLGWLFLFTGILGLVTTIWMRQLPGFWWSLLSALLAIATGAALLWWPFGGVLSLTLGLAI